MKLQPVGDLHLDMQSVAIQRKIMQSLVSQEEVDVLLLAGDIFSIGNVKEVVSFLSSRWENIIYVPGNHDYLGETIQDFENKLEEVADIYLNFFPFTQSSKTITIGHQRFVGGTLWYPFNVEASHLAPSWWDFIHLRDFNLDMADAFNRDLVMFMDSNLKSTDVVLTHHLPSFQSVSERFRGMDTNCFFANNLDELILDKQPKLWVHGHTHNNFDYKIGKTRVLCNPLGYTWRGEGKDFDKHLIVEV